MSNSELELELVRSLEESIEKYNQLCEQTNNFNPLSGNHYSGTCYIFFKGSYNNVVEMRKLLNLGSIKNHSHIFGSVDE